MPLAQHYETHKTKVKLLFKAYPRPKTSFLNLFFLLPLNTTVPHSSSYDKLSEAGCWSSFYLIADPDDDQNYDQDDDDDQNDDDDDDGGAQAGPAFT